MRIAGRRTDGALFLNVGAGMACILKGERVSPVVDLSVIANMGPWHTVTEDERTFEARRRVQAKADLARVVSLDSFLDLSMSFDEQRERVMTALRAKLGLPALGSYAPYPMGMDFYVPQNGMGEDWVVYSMQGKHFGLPYSMDDTGAVSFDAAPVEVHQTWESLDEDDDTTFSASSLDLKQTAWFKKFMANKKKNLAKVKATEMPGSLPNV